MQLNTNNNNTNNTPSNLFLHMTDMDFDTFYIYINFQFFQKYHPLTIISNLIFVYANKIKNNNNIIIISYMKKK